jgi:galactose mutarotase-like enzyme
MKVTMKNKQLEVSVNTMGAEICSVRDCETKEEFMWNADPKYWKRYAPILFPFVGLVRDKQYSYQGKRYQMGQHGFARDMEFQLIEQTEEELWFELNSNATTLENYPFEFKLQLGYQLEERTVKVMYRVINPSKEVMYFSIGAHPAFICPYDENKSAYYVRLNHTKKLESYYLDTKLGVREMDAKEVEFAYIDSEYAYIKLTKELFAKDALIIENTEITEVSLCYEDKTPYVTVEFDAPLFGIWSPANTGAPFVCIEPWYGRCDAINSPEELDKKEYVNKLNPEESFEKSYTITF